MGRTADENVPTNNDPNPGTVKLSDIRNDYNAGMNVQQLSDKYNVDTEVIIDKLDLYSQETKETGKKDEATTSDNKPEGE